MHASGCRARQCVVGAVGADPARRDRYSQPIDDAKDKGTETGLRMALFTGQVQASLSRWQTDMQGQAIATIRNPISVAISKLSPASTTGPARASPSAGVCPNRGHLCSATRWNSEIQPLRDMKTATTNPSPANKQTTPTQAALIRRQFLVRAAVVGGALATPVGAFGQPEPVAQGQGVDAAELTRDWRLQSIEPCAELTADFLREAGRAAAADGWLPGESKTVRVLGQHRQGRISAKAWYASQSATVDWRSA